MNNLLESILSRLENRSEPSPLTPRHIWDADIEADIVALELSGAAGKKSAIALKAGLHLLNDSLDVSHSYAQEIEDDSTGAYWHGLMHRMEQDYWNSKYWFRQAGNHPVKQTARAEIAEWLKQEGALDSLPSGRIASELLNYRDRRGWESGSFVDLIEEQESGKGSPGTKRILESLQQIELKALLRYTCDAAVRR